MCATHQQQVEVLHVDDDPDFTELAKGFLERKDSQLTVETATNTDEGLQHVSDRPPDCVVSDYNMIGMDGIEFLETVREDHPDLPFILFTGRGSETVASKAIAAGVTDYLQKDSGVEQYELLANRIQDAVEAQRGAEQVTRQEQLMRLTELAGDTGGFEVDLETGAVLLTAGTRRLVGLPEETQITLEEAINFYHPDDQADVRQTVIQAAETGDQTRGSWRLQTTDGEQRFVDVTITPATEGNDTAIVRGAFRDVTEQRAREQKLNAEQRIIEQALDTLDSLFYVLNTDGTLRRWNTKALELTGYTEQELAEIHATELFAYDDRETIRDAIETTLVDGQVAVEAALLTANGECRSYEFTGRQLTDADGNVTGLIGIGR
jgi:PAS domain S-box